VIATWEGAGMVEPFDSYPDGGRALLGRRSGSNARWEYGLKLQRLTGQTRCAWCDVDLVSDYHHWLLLTVDHVVPTAEVRRLGIPLDLSEDFLNLVISCAGCNGFDNQYRSTKTPLQAWSIEDFAAFRDAVFLERRPRIAKRRDSEMEFFRGRPWLSSQL
jgi:hypothetical protein